MNSDKRWLTAFCPFYGCLSGVLCSWPIRLLAVQGLSLSPVGNPALFLFFVISSCKNKQKQAKTSKNHGRDGAPRWYFPFFSGFSWTSPGGPRGSNGERSTSYPLGQVGSQDYCWFKRYESSPLLASRLKSGKLLIFLVQHEIGPRLFYGADRAWKLYLSVMLGSHRPWY